MDSRLPGSGLASLTDSRRRTGGHRNLAGKNDPILVVGGGLGGASVALALARKGFKVRLLEQAPEFGVIGYGIQLGPNVFPMFDRLGVTEAVLQQSIIPQAVLMIDSVDAGVIARIPTGTSFVERFKRPYIVIHRVDLHRILLDACAADDNIELMPLTGAVLLRGPRGSCSSANDTRPDPRGRGGDRRRWAALDDPAPNAGRRRAADGRLRRPSHDCTDGGCARRRPSRGGGAVVRARLPHRALSAAHGHAVQHRRGVQDLHLSGAGRHRELSRGDRPHLSR